MKTLTILFTLFVTSFQHEHPGTTKDFELTLEKSELQLTRATSQHLNIGLDRAKGYQKAPARMGISSFLPSGITVQFNPAEGIIEQTEAVITADSTASPGNYTVILKATVNNKTKGTTLNLIVL